MGSVFTESEKREKVVNLSLLSNREVVDGWDCMTCGEPVEEAGVGVGFAVCNRCEVVVDIEPDAPTSERETG
jgi:hypothetical protein